MFPWAETDDSGRRRRPIAAGWAGTSRPRRARPSSQGSAANGSGAGKKNHASARNGTAGQGFDCRRGGGEVGEAGEQEQPTSRRESPEGEKHHAEVDPRPRVEKDPAPPRLGRFADGQPEPTVPVESSVDRTREDHE